MLKEGIIICIVCIFLGGCASQKLVYMRGSDKAKAVIEVSMTGGRVSLDGPFEYCSEPAVVGEPTVAVADSVCIAIVGELNAGTLINE